MDIPVLHVEGESLAEAYEKALVELHDEAEAAVRAKIRAQDSAAGETSP